MIAPTNRLILLSAAVALPLLSAASDLLISTSI